MDNKKINNGTNSKPSYKKPNKTFKYKHVKINRVRPKLSKGNYNPKKNSSKPVDKAGFVKKDKNSKLRVIPLGGLDAIGNNMTVFECNNQMILDDAGLMFPGDNHPGIDLILPDYTYVLQNINKLKAIVITHGHEDHIGCLPYLMKDLDQNIPIYASKMSLGLIKSKFDEFDIKNISLNEIKSGDSVNIGCYRISFFTVNHSIPGALGLFLQSPAGNILHTGDFKFDLTPVGGEQTDFSLISKFSKIGIDLLMSDSTNATVKETTPSESSVGPVLEDIISKSKGKVVVATFASHIHRIQQVCDAAVKCKRKIVVAGRSMIQNVDISRELGYLKVSDENIIDAYELNNIPSDKAVVLCTGSQGEPLSALSRIANGSHKTIDIEKGDTVIISATPVPGNEKAVSIVINKLFKQGVDVYDKNTSLVHVSGHASIESLKLMINLCKPKGFLPVHGETRHLLAHARLAEMSGINPKNVFLCDNGDVIELSDSKFKRKESIESGVVYVDGLSVGDTSKDVLDERKLLAEAGVIIVCAAIDMKHMNIKGDIRLNLKGIAGSEDESFQDDFKKVVAQTIFKEIKHSKDIKHLKKSIRDAIYRISKDKINQRPMLNINLIEM